VLIGLVGHIAAGKTTIANWLMNEYEIEYNDTKYSFARYAFCDHLKFLLQISKIPRTRENMQEFGDAMRSWRPNIWIDYVTHCMDEDNWPFQVIDDVRFVNEAQFVLRQGGFLVGLMVTSQILFKRVKERMRNKDEYIGWHDFDRQLRHASETQVDECFKLCHLKLNNDRPIEQTQSAIGAFIEYERGNQRDNR